MRITLLILMSGAGSLLAADVQQAAAPAASTNIPNRLIDYDRFLAGAVGVGRLRNQHRVSEDQFIAMSAEPGTIILDARSDARYRQLHVKEARHLSFSDITATELAKVIPSKTTRVLIYCNNNFLNAPESFAAKAPSASLNIHTFNTLYNYGYTNVYELGPLLDIRSTKLSFDGTAVEGGSGRL